VRITSGDVTGASVTVDGRAVGSTPLTTKLRRGKYALRVEKSGYEAVDRTFEVAGQDETLIAVTLSRVGAQFIAPVATPVEKKGEPVVPVKPAETPVGDVGAQRAASGALRIWKWVTLGGAVAALGGGAGLLAQHFIEVNKTPPAGMEKGETKPYGLYAGASLAAVGVGLGVSSVILFVKDANDRRGAWPAPEQRASAAWLTPTPGGFAVGVSGTW
jgi:hypothetical protein